jgi:glutathione S-transferase
MADITLFASLAFAQAIGLPIASDLTALARWHATVSDIPAVKYRSGQAPLAEDLARVGL